MSNSYKLTIQYYRNNRWFIEDNFPTFLNLDSARAKVADLIEKTDYKEFQNVREIEFIITRHKDGLAYLASLNRLNVCNGVSSESIPFNLEKKG